MKRDELRVGTHLALKTDDDPSFPGNPDIFAYRRVMVLSAGPYIGRGGGLGGGGGIGSSLPQPAVAGPGVYVQPCMRDGKAMGGAPFVALLPFLMGPYDEVHKEQETLRKKASVERARQEEEHITAVAARRGKLEAIRPLLPSIDVPPGVALPDRASVNIEELFTLFVKEGLFRERVDETK